MRVPFHHVDPRCRISVIDPWQTVIAGYVQWQGFSTLIEGDRRMIGFHRVVHMPRGLVRKTCLTCKTRWPCPHHVLSLAVTETTWLEEDPLWMDPLWPDPFDLEGDDPR
ncbi:hypothetical protein FB566_0143 [Stackebrandtia endophytica]|uniref:Uncharacterized protein n=1 Tax=Stackebrandtia endophytica TaxID=1496996 RepID=A0A543APZ9_9ACTN|nr:hypothetical protein FB566_0143 [Stackebrandtia endophytica]